MHARVATYRGARSDDLIAFLPQLAATIERAFDDPPPGLEGLREILVLVDASRVARWA
jgi:hypothetical protein